jgi:hypothetical protein
MNGEAKGGRLKGVNLDLLSLCVLTGLEGLASNSGVSGGDDCPSSVLCGWSFSCFSGIALRKRMASGLTETMSPGAKRVFAFWCCKMGSKKKTVVQFVRCSPGRPTHLLTVKLDIPVNDEAPSFVNAVRKTAPKYENVDPSLYLDKHQASNRR